MSNKSFNSEVAIRRNENSWIIDIQCTKECGKLLRKTIDVFGNLIDIDSSADIHSIAKKISMLNNPKQNETFINQLNAIESLTLIVFNGKDNDSPVEYSYTVAGENLLNAEKHIDIIAVNEIIKDKYKDGKERKVAVFTSTGGELKSAVFSKSNPNIIKAKTNKP